MSNYVPLEQAAKLLGLSTERLNELRLKNEIFGTRDGNAWKFKMEEVQRYAEEIGVNLSGAGDSDALSGDSEIHLSDSGIKLDDSGIDLSGAAVPPADSSLKLDDSGDVLGDDEELTFGSSDIKLAAESSGNVLSGDEPSDEGSPSDTGKMAGGSGGLELDEEELFDDDLLLQESASFEESSDLSSDFESSELLLDDSDSDSEVDIDSGDTGINLGPTDSGISLEEEPLELGGSDIDSLELPEDDEIISLEEAADIDSSSGDIGASEDDFNLTPLEDSMDEDLSSGSQVIALEDSSIYTDDSAPTMISEGEEYGQPLVAADAGYAAPVATAEPGAVVYAPPEAPYSIWQILSLFLAAILVGLLTLVTIDLARNLWQPSGVTLSNSLVNFFLRLFGYDVEA